MEIESVVPSGCTTYICGVSM